MEILAVIAFILFIFIPLMFFVYSKSAEIDHNSVVLAEEYLLSEISRSSSIIAISGNGSAIKKSLIVPITVESISIDRVNEVSFIVITDRFGNQLTDRIFGNVYFSHSGDLRKGEVVFLFEKMPDGRVKISQI